MAENRHTGVMQPPARLRQLPQDTFERFQDLIQREVGIRMPPTKKTMLEARLHKRLRALGMKDYSEYCDYLFSPSGMDEEFVHLIDVVTTNTTDFFREPQHFEYLKDDLLPLWFARLGARRRMKIWSAGCSVGMEPYTLAMVLAEFAERNPGFEFDILATDISTQALEKASRAIYDAERVEPVPAALKSKYLLRSKDRTRRQVRIVPELRGAIHFRRLNFMEPFGFREQMDVIFCRNVIIYFDRSTQLTLFAKFCHVLVPGGYLFIGHSESLTGMDLPLRQVAPTIYQRL